MRYTHIGAKKKYKAHNSKYVRHIFCLLKTRSKSILKPQTNKDTRILHLKYMVLLSCIVAVIVHYNILYPSKELNL